MTPSIVPVAVNLLLLQLAVAAGDVCQQFPFNRPREDLDTQVYIYSVIQGTSKPESIHPYRLQRYLWVPTSTQLYIIYGGTHAGASRYKCKQCRSTKSLIRTRAWVPRAWSHYIPCGFLLAFTVGSTLWWCIDLPQPAKHGLPRQIAWNRVTAAGNPYTTLTETMQ